MALDHPPAGWALDDPPAGTHLVGEEGVVDVGLGFFCSAGELAERLPGLAERVFPDGMVWALWPRRAAGHQSDITDGVVRELALGLGLVDTKVAAVDEDWSGLRLVWRRSRRRGGGGTFGAHL